MKNQPVDRFPKAATACVTLLLITIAILAGHGETHATPIAEINPAFQPLQAIDGDDETVPLAMNAASAEGLIWVRQEPAVINANNDPLRYDATEDRFKGTFTEYTVGETNIGMHDRYVDHGWEGYNVTINSLFDRPPIVLNPPLRYKIRASFSHDGIHNPGSGSVGAQFWYSSDWGILEPSNEVLGYYPFDDWWDGTSSKEWMLSAPPATREGETFEVSAGWWNCAPCNVTWTYKAEPANAVERLGVEVVQPVVSYQDEEVPPGETYFPETCPDSTSRAATTDCSYQQEMEERAEVLFKCLEGLGGRERLMLLLQLVRLQKDPDDDTFIKLVIVLIADVKLAENCGYKVGSSHVYQQEQGNAYQLDLTLEQGAMLLDNVLDGQTIGVNTPLGTVAAATQGAFLTGYNPNTRIATFRAYSAPLTLQAMNGTKLILQPPQEVELTSKGFGPVTKLPHSFLPMLIR